MIPDNYSKRKPLLFPFVCALAIVLLCVGCSLFLHQKTEPVPLAEQEHKEWKDYGGGPDHSKYVDMKQITKANVKDLGIAFSYSTGDNLTYSFNPIIVDNVMYVLAKNNSLVAVDATTGKEIWIHSNLNGIIARGINFWQSKDKKQKRFIIFLNNTMQAIDANTGKSIMDFGESGQGYTDMRMHLDRDTSSLGRMTSTTPGHIFEDLILVGSAPGENPFDGPGHLRAYNVITGKLAWVFHTIPLPGEYGYNTWPKDAYKYVGAVNTWGEISVDEKRGIAYYPLGSPTYDYDGADRAGTGLFGNCILALDARTGKRLWHFQTVHHDIWDYDLTAAPQLITVSHNGKKVDAVAVAAKTGFLFVLDRVTGEPLWPIEERPVPKSEMPFEQSWPTQPFPTVVPAFNRQVISASDLNPYYTASKRDSMIKRINAAKSGLFQPLSDKYEVFAMPGSTGGANFGGTAANPEKGLVYVLTKETGSIYRLKLRQPRITPIAGDRLAQAQGVYTQACQACHGADRNGLSGLGSSLVGLDSRVTAVGFKQIINNGKGRMPAMPHLDDATVNDLYAFLTQRRGGNAPQNRGGAAQFRNEIRTIDGPVVDSGGVTLPTFATRKQVGYPADYTGPKAIYIEANNWGEDAANVLAPPWSWVVAYDLNKGTIKWKVPFGNEDDIAGGKNLGKISGSARKGMVVTATGIVFAICGDGKVYAYDEDNGNTIWSYDLGRANPSGIPAMYEANGRQYLVVCSTGRLLDRTKKEEDVPKGYVVFALPQIAQKK
ncbi:MAG: PQQ-binding-like beta-propeller repeat protein [Flavisolibacter sp.]|nr:PQQ-binding-like beta-propeller repeat protein [Flavisolibacter sp.]